MKHNKIAKLSKLEKQLQKNNLSLNVPLIIDNQQILYIYGLFIISSYFPENLTNENWIRVFFFGTVLNKCSIKDRDEEIS